jgi:hypothetical protein
MNEEEQAIMTTVIIDRAPLHYCVFNLKAWWWSKED